MKTSISNIKNKGILFLVMSLILSATGFSQNKIVVLVSAVNFNFVLPIACVLGLGVFLFTAYIKQKNH